MPNPDTQIATTGSTPCSPELWTRLTDTSLGFEQAAALVASSSRSELQAVAVALEERAAPCGEQAVIATLAPLATLYGIAGKSQGEWRAFWRFYIDALSNVPLEAIKAGVADYVQRPDSEFFPKPGPLKAICLRHAEQLFTALGRSRRALRLA